MNRMGKLLVIASLLALPIAMAGCPAEDDGISTPAPKKSATPNPNFSGSIG